MDAPKNGWNPRYLAYCKDQGNTPEEQLRIDEEAYPEAKMSGFILWVTARVQQQKKKTTKVRRAA